MKLIYGVTLTEDRQAQIDPQQAAVVKEIYRQYLAGKSLGGIADFLFEKGIRSPTGKDRWSRSVIDHLLSNGLYTYGIVPFGTFYAAQIEKARRSNLDPDKGPKARKATQYHSKNILSGLLVCGECGHIYRRITRPSGEIVWRCANRVENGKRANCHAPSIPEAELKDKVCKMLGLDEFKSEAVRGRLESIQVASDGSLYPVYAEEPMIELSL